MRLRNSILITVMCATVPLSAQFWDKLLNPDVEVTLTHPPALGIKVKRVAFAPVSTHDADELVSVCISDLLAAGEIEVLDRANTSKTLAEQKFSNSVLADSASAVEMGRLLGSPVLLFVKVFSLKTSHTPLQRTTDGWTDKKGKYYPPVTTYTSKTQVELSASVQAVDCATGKVYSQQRIAVSPSQEQSSDQGRPEYPSDTHVKELAMNQAKSQVHRMLLSWTEKRKLTFFDDKDYGMKEGFVRLQLNDYPGALAKSMDALAKAKADAGVKPKYLGHANYNVAMCYFILGDYDPAVPILKAARETDPTQKTYIIAMEQIEQAIKLRDEMGKVDTRSAKLEVAEPIAVAPPPPPTPEPKSASAGAGASAEDRLERLEKLRKKGLLTPQEYKERKAVIMKEL